ncbi:UDP-N-acetylmuramyl tripeptide synthase [Elusimicrobium minutum Pei191]|uniref:UDP-N-acetylmuramoyl-L-alanyl-D-glutamate--2,6-diaminopimelate ligase n=1 Tax=Elusimicrobium minutum (strain Pei191) TaxID=445932 RepID=B2KEW3_ELUMP|nr:UDP-N-acetylmuramoyl-L-alanyl-D-glutamate--2,6-diaminopimelate ligase [Elusimicrobium minutum]ACC99059.1 UDP-N-acetylmuramyl tripeptide synthase [Elusimicrobium minutum Pei191]
MKLKDFFNTDSEVEVGEITQNSKLVVPGDIFFAIKGAKVDGNDFIDDAVSKGAVAVVSTEPAKKKYPVPYFQVDDIDLAMAKAAVKFYKNPSDDMFFIGITGTKGKTSISYLLESIFNEAGIPCSVIGTINYRINGEVFAKAPNTTPAALYLYYMIDKMRSAGTKVVIMEVSSHALELKRVFGLNFDVALFTNLQRDHMDFHKNFENYFAAKEKLFDSLIENSKPAKTAIVNIDDQYGLRLADKIKAKTTLIPVSLVEAENVKESLNGVTFSYKGESASINLLGKHNLYNAVFAVKAAMAYGVDLQTALKGIAKLQGIPGRMQRVNKGQPFYVFVDFAYTTESLMKAYETLEPYKNGNIITVFGCGGDRDRTKRPLMGLAACQNSSHVLLTNDNPRTEDQQQIFNDILNGMKGYTNYEIVQDRALAIKTGISLCKENDILLIAGKGHEDYQILAGKTIHFSDRETAETELEKLGYVQKQ